MKKLNQANWNIREIKFYIKVAKIMPQSRIVSHKEVLTPNNSYLSMEIRDLKKYAIANIKFF